MRLIIAALWLTLGVGSLAAETAPEWTGEKRDLDSGSCRGSATISADKESVPLGEMFSVDVRFLNKSNGETFYNPFLLDKGPLPVELAIYDADHKYLGHLFPTHLYESSADGNDWIFIPSLCYVGCSVKFMAGNVPEVAERGGSGLLPPGEYCVQMIYFKAFLARNPAKRERRPLEDDEKMFRQFEKNFDRAELFRSNVVKVRFTKP
jgi:hypothetical protein